MKKSLLTLLVVFFVVFGNAQKLRDDLEVKRPEKQVLVVKSDTKIGRAHV